MKNLSAHRIGRMTACRVDLLQSGVHLDGMPRPCLVAFVNDQLEYFQAMLGDDSSGGEVVALVCQERASRDGSGQASGIGPPAITDGAAAEAQGRAERLERRRQAMALMSLDELFAAASELRRRSAEVIEQMDVVQERFEELNR